MIPPGYIIQYFIMNYQVRTYFVYILRCSDNSYYTGITNNVLRRFREHQSGMHPRSYTYSRRPLELLFTREFPRPMMAIRFEKQVKRWSRAKKVALIKGDFDALKRLARCRSKMRKEAG